MSIKDTLGADLKAAMLGGDKELTTTLRGLKAAILTVEIANGSRDTGLSDEDITTLFAKEAKKRQESADFFKQGGNEIKAAAELQEKAVIERYLPTQLTDDELTTIVDSVVADMGAINIAQMGQIIGRIRAQVGAGADGGRISAAVKARIGESQ